MSKENINPILLTPMQAKNILGVGRNEIYRLCNTKGFPSFKIGQKNYINREKLQEWADKQCK
ncbi:helix-turn-helix domain-containing protein [Clostridium perfringens]|uniref:helix-turn-helix domain-containing protein n=1 Tax=Clostridium perfringens TaxID=1502 RepID=UPI002940716B|nr:helix-turn-helix domain-containing protein [Clostridium perfringens]MDV5112710.1 helix-turn-helix domain-containing protein [Clostridium perfringens]